MDYKSIIECSLDIAGVPWNCPSCKENDLDKLIWTDDELLVCHTCGMVRDGSGFLEILENKEIFLTCKHTFDKKAEKAELANYHMSKVINSMGLCWVLKWLELWCESSPSLKERKVSDDLFNILCYIDQG